ncbi:MAG: HD domain-containing protein [Rhodocyclaceae bacterium]|nr:HD domain-containing protein [Rhodocyclaceae bacterium]
MTHADSRYENLARQALDDGAHYVKTVADLAHRTELVADADIYAADGTRLAAKGALIGGELRDKLLKHKLLRPAGLSFSVPDGAMSTSLAQQTARLIDGDACLRQLAERSGDALDMRHGLARLSLPPTLAFMLTVAREQRPRLFRHLLLVALIAHYLALCRGLSEKDTASLLVAALCHDLGELHTDPALLDPQHRIGDTERRYIYVHPITGHLIAREFAQFDPAVATAVLQHQERLDGSGYPYGLRAERIGTFARIVGIADVCASILDRFGSNERLAALMRLNRQKFDIGLLALLHEGIGHPSPAPAVPRSAPQARLQAAAGLLERWAEFRPALAGAGSGQPVPELAFLVERMASLRHMLLQFGFDPDSQQLLMELLADDPQIAAELDAALDEVRWQFADLEREIARRREVIEPLLTADGKRLLNEWTTQLRAHLAAAGD